MNKDIKSRKDLIEGVEKFYNIVESSGVLKNNEKKNEKKDEKNNIEEVKTNLFNKATENKKIQESKEDTGSKLISYDVKGLDPRKNIFNYNPQANVGFDVGDKNRGLYATGDLDASIKGVNTNLQAGFKNENFDVSINPERGLNYQFNKQFGDNTNVNINQFGAQVGTKLGDNTNVNLAYNNQNFNPSLNTNLLNTNIAVNPNRLDVNRTFEIGDDTQIKVGGEVDFDGEAKGDIEFTKDFLNKKLQVYGGADTKGDFEVGTKFKFLNL